MPLYSAKVIDHFRNPRNVGEIVSADGVGEEGNASCGDLMVCYVKLSGGRLSDVKFKTCGCGVAIAVSSVVSEMAQGKSINEAWGITADGLIDELGGIPEDNRRCAELAPAALNKAINAALKRVR